MSSARRAGRSSPPKRSRSDAPALRRVRRRPAGRRAGRRAVGSSDRVLRAFRRRNAFRRRRAGAGTRLHRRGETPDPAPRAVAAGLIARSEQPGVRPAGRHRLRPGAVLRSAPVDLRRGPPVRPATRRTGPGPTAWRAAAGTAPSTATRPACSTCASTAGSAGTARRTRCGHRTCGPCSMRARWASAPAARRGWFAPTGSSPAATGALSAKRPAHGRRTGLRRSRQGTGGVPGNPGHRSHAVRRLPRCAGTQRRGRQGPLSRRRGARPAPVRRPGQLLLLPFRPGPSPTASSPMPACRTSSSPAGSTPAGTAASASCARARTLCWAASTTMRNAPPPPRPAMSACARATSASSGCRAFATSHSPRPTCTPEASPTLADVARHYSTLDEERLHAGGERILRRLDLGARELADLVAFLETLTEKEPLHEFAENTGNPPKSCLL